MASSRPSGRQSARSTAQSSRRMDAAPARASQRGAAASQRGAAGNSGRSQRSSGRSAGGDKKVFIIIGCVIAVLVSVVLVLYFYRTGQRQEHDQKKADEAAVKEKNIEMAKKYFTQAYNAGFPWITGKKEATEDEMMAQFKGDDQIYNVVFERTIKVKKDEKTTTYRKDATRSTIDKISPPLKVVDDEKYEICKGLTSDKSVDLIVAEKFIPGDGVSMTGGKVTIVLKALK